MGEFKQYDYVVKREKYDLVYRVYCPERTSFLRYIIHQGYNLYEIGASYAKQRPNSYYYILSKDEKTAKKEFKNFFDYMDVREIRLCDEEEKEKVANDSRMLI